MVHADSSTVYADKQSRFKTLVHRQSMTVHFGQAGCNIGKCLWETWAKEHNLTLDGRLQTAENGEPLHHYDLEPLFDEVIDVARNQEYYVPRAVLVDNTWDVLEGIMQSNCGNFFTRGNSVLGTIKNTTFASMYGSGDTQFVDNAQTVCRQVMENMECGSHCTITRGAAGAVGGAIAPRITEFVASHLRSVVNCEVVPNHYHSYSSVEAYNYILSTASMNESCTAFIKYDNNQLYQMIHRVMGDTVIPSLDNMNQLMVHSISMASNNSSRLANCDTFSSSTDLIKSMIPFPDLKHMIPAASGVYNNLVIDYVNPTSVRKLLGESMLQKCNFIELAEKSKVISLGAMFRGKWQYKSLVNNFNAVLNPTGDDERFFEWAGQPYCNLFQISLPAIYPQRFEILEAPWTLYKYSNETGMNEHYMLWLDKFCSLLNKGAFTGIYRDEGIEVDEFKEAFEVVKKVCTLYSEIGNPEAN